MSGRVTCPYNPQHIMPADRLQWHLTMVCRDMRAQSHLFSICPYNRTHHVLTPKLDDHVRKCPDKPKEGKMSEDLAAIQKIIGPAEDAWESSWPEERKNLNEEYIPAVAQRKRQPGAQQVSNLNEARQEPAAANPYITPMQPESNTPPVSSAPAEDDGWVTLKPKKREQRPNFDWNDPPDVSVAQTQADLSRKAKGGKRRSGKD